MKFLRDGLSPNQAARTSHLDAYAQLCTAHPAKRQTFEFLYGNLTIVDAKTAALLQFNSIGMGIAGLLIAISGDARVRSVLFATLILFAFACIVSMKGIVLHWASTKDFEDVDAYLERLLHLRDRRTYMYRLSWFLGFCALIVCIMLVLLIAVVGPRHVLS